MRKTSEIARELLERWEIDPSEAEGLRKKVERTRSKLGKGASLSEIEADMIHYLEERQISAPIKFHELDSGTHARAEEHRERIDSFLLRARTYSTENERRAWEAGQFPTIHEISSALDYSDFALAALRIELETSGLIDEPSTEWPQALARALASVRRFKAAMSLMNGPSDVQRVANAPQWPNGVPYPFHLPYLAPECSCDAQWVEAFGCPDDGKEWVWEFLPNGRMRVEFRAEGGELPD